MLRKILVLGTGKSTPFLLDYLLYRAGKEKLHLTICDLDREALPKKIKGHPACDVIRLDIFNERERNRIIKDSDIVISMLPSHFHIVVAKDCIAHKKHLVTA